MADVYLARDEILGRDVALKVLREQYAHNEEFVERFKREAQSAANLSHPHIVQIYDRGETESGTYYIVMEYVPGGTLKHLIRERGVLAPEAAAEAAIQIADALEQAHERGIIHRDVKPQNVLVTENGDAKVADFGIARAASAATISETSLVLGTANYMSPEQAMGKPLDGRSDLYSLGVVLYEMLVGEIPFSADTPVGVGMKHVTEPPRSPKESNPGIPAALNAIVMALLAKKPADRYGSAAELAEHLQRFLDGQVPEGEPETSLATPPPVVQSAPPNETRATGYFVGGGRRRGRFAKRLALTSIALLVATLVLLGAVASSLLDSVEGPGSVARALADVPREALEGVGQAIGEIAGPSVPEVQGLTSEEAQARLADAGFESSVQGRESSPEDVGRVLDQSIPGGERTEEGTRVILGIGEGPRPADTGEGSPPAGAGEGTDLVEAPDLAGQDAEEAARALEEAGLVLGEVRESASETVPAGAVIGQNPPAGTALPPGTRVDLIVSSGPGQVVVPDVSYTSIEEATRVLVEAGFSVVDTREELSTEPAGTVVGTDPPVGSVVEPGTEVTLVVSSGPPEAIPEEQAPPQTPEDAPQAPPAGDDAQPAPVEPAPAPPEAVPEAEEPAPAPAVPEAVPTDEASAAPTAPTAP